MAIPTLAITGPGGVGKTTVALEVSRQLEASGVGHALIDMDELDRLFPPPPGDPCKSGLTTRNLAAMWTNFREAGASRLVLVAVMRSPERELPYINAAIPAADILVVRLRVAGETLSERVWRREVGSGGEAQIRRSLDQSCEWEREPVNGQLIVETSGRSITEIAAEILQRSGWPV
ncbi:MAG: hypothetical protein ACR2HO_01025 [Rubrobacteraceae bacterium]